MVHNTDEDDFMTNSACSSPPAQQQHPPLVYADFPARGPEVLEQILSNLGARRSPSAGVSGANHEAVGGDEARRTPGPTAGTRKTSALDDLAKAFSLSAVPYRMECYDISSFQGSNPVASRVVFMGGAPDKTLYRHYRIRDIEGQDDHA